MFRYIFNSLLLSFLLIGIVTAFTTLDHLDVEMGEEDYKPSNSLDVIGRQRGDGGHHRAVFNLQTKIPSFNPDRSGAKSVVCNTDANGKRKISFSLRDKKAVEHLNEWPEEEVMLFISHKWECFGERSAQFFNATDKVIDETKLSVTFDVIKIDHHHHSHEFSLDLNWVEGNKSKNNTHPNLERRFSDIDTNNKIDLTVLFDHHTGRTSKPDLKLFKKHGINLICENCYTKGESTIVLRVRGRIFPPKIKEAFISFDGNFHMNLDFILGEPKNKASDYTKGDQGKAKDGSAGGGKEKPKSSGINEEMMLLSIGLGPFNIPGILNVGPSIDFVVSADIVSEIYGAVKFGGELSLPDFHVTASFHDNPYSEDSRFNPQVTSHDVQADVDGFKISVLASLKPQLAFGIDILNGKLLRQKIGFELVGTLENSVEIGTCENLSSPRIGSYLHGRVGFFANSHHLPIVKFPSHTLFDKCL